MSARGNPLVRLVRQPPPGLDQPIQIRFTANGSAVTYLLGSRASNVRSLWWHDLAGGTRRELARAPQAATRRTGLRREDELARQRRRQSGLGLTDYRSSPGSDLLVSVATGHCLVSKGGAPAQPLEGWDAVQDAIPSPDGTRLAVIQAGDLWVVPLDGGGTRLTHDAEPGRTNGLPEYVASEELDRFEGCWWSADATALAWASVDERHVPEIAIEHLGDDGRGGTPSDRHRYPFAGAPNAQVTLQVRDLASATTRDVDVGIGDGYLARMVPHPDGGWLVAVLPRHQRALRWWRVTVSGVAAELWEERTAPWINLDDATRVLGDGRILRATESSGTRHLELRHPDGSLDRRLTAGPWVVTEVVHLDERRGEVLFMGTADGVTQRHAYAVALDAARPDERPMRLTAEPGWHALVLSRDGARWADTWSTRERAPEVVIRERDGQGRVVIHAPSATAPRLQIVVPELRTFAAADGVTPLHGAIFRPRVPAATPPPAVVWVYGGPHVQSVRDAWDLTVLPLRQALADAGFAVVVVDGRGSANRGLPFEAHLAGALGAAEVDDQAAVVDRLAGEAVLDPARVGITGGSYGGYMTIRSMIRRSDLFRAGVAIAPVIDWEGYDSAYTERYLGDPAGGADAYARSSIPGTASLIDGDLLVIHGTLDENVHPRHSERLIEATVAGNRPVEVLWLTGERHRTQSRARILLRDRSSVAHLCRALGVAVPEEIARALAREAQPDLGDGGRDHPVRRPRTAG